MTGPPAEPDAKIDAMRVAVIDVGSNTARLLVADVDGSTKPVLEERAYLGLAADILRHGAVSTPKQREAAAVVRRYARLAAGLDAERVAAVVTAPGRQGSSHGLVDALATAAGRPVRVLSAAEEGRFAFLGATEGLDDAGGVVAVCDVGGGSTEIAVGTVLLGPAWIRSADLGSLRLTRTFFTSDPPTADEVEAARRTIDGMLASFDPPRADLALAVGGSARAAAKVLGGVLEPDGLARLVGLAARRSAADLSRRVGVDRTRAETLLGGALVLSALAERLQLPLQVERGGLREGIARELARPAVDVAA
jgi:exopolyphosphatase/guanosine-5'-triphosphate,3'-diphosphate pyrophosphatase